jgi:diguanylate cyclase (GGDEF)-like protein
MRRQQAAAHFHDTVTAYLGRYGDWRSAMATEPFDEFAWRLRREERQRAAQQGMPGQSPQAMRATDQPGPPDAGRDPDNAPGDLSDDLPPLPGRPPRMDSPPGQGGFGPPDGGRPEGSQRPRREPPFHFILTDSDFHVLLGAGVYGDGEALPQAARKDVMPVVVNGRTLAYVSPEGVLTPSKQEQEYMETIHDALMVGAGSAAALAIALGLLLGTGLSRRLLGLTEAVRAMQGGALRQQVPVGGGDEVGTLATAFNTMSAQLAQNHEELQAQHQTILQQATQLKELSIRDALTELYNRRHFDEQASMLYKQSARHGRPMSVVIADIDFFKRINDQFSHATGDEVLRQVSAIIRSHVRLSDLVARYGGEEFVIALPETALPQAAALCDKLRDMIERFPWHQVHPGLNVTMSMGVYGDLAAGTAEAMLKKADELLYRAKESGRNRVCFS